MKSTDRIVNTYSRERDIVEYSDTNIRTAVQIQKRQGFQKFTTTPKTLALISCAKHLELEIIIPSSARVRSTSVLILI
jgi:hypothetical protein